MKFYRSIAALLLIASVHIGCIHTDKSPNKAREGSEPDKVKVKKSVDRDNTVTEEVDTLPPVVKEDTLPVVPIERAPLD